MEPMKPMEPMAEMTPMKPMEPLKPLSTSTSTSWWPVELGQPSSTGSQNGVRYAVFPGARRLLLRRDGIVEQYDTGDHQIQGASQASDQAGGTAIFRSAQGPVDLAAFTRIEDR